MASSNNRLLKRLLNHKVIAEEANGKTAKMYLRPEKGKENGCERKGKSSGFA